MYFGSEYHDLLKNSPNKSPSWGASCSPMHGETTIFKISFQNRFLNRFICVFVDYNFQEDFHTFYIESKDYYDITIINEINCTQIFDSARTGEMCANCY